MCFIVSKLQKSKFRKNVQIRQCCVDPTIWTFYGLSACSFVTGLRIRFMCGYPRGPLGFHMGMGTSIHSVLQEPYSPVQMLCPYDQWCRALRGPVRPVSAGLGYIYQAKQDYVTFDPLGPTRLLTGLLWVEIVGSPCLEVVHAQSSAVGYTAPAQYKILRNIVWTRNACLVISHGNTFGPYGRLSELHVTKA